MAKMVCTNCGHFGTSRTHTPGSFVVERFAWLLFILPGLVYSLYRVSARKKVCAMCGAAQLVPEHSPLGQRIIRVRHRHNQHSLYEVGRRRPINNPRAGASSW
jgi:hypothetical protein